MHFTAYTALHYIVWPYIALNWIVWHSTTLHWMQRKKKVFLCGSRVPKPKVKNVDHITEEVDYKRVDFVYWWSSIGEGLLPTGLPRLVSSPQSSIFPPSVGRQRVIPYSPLGNIEKNDLAEIIVCLTLTSLNIGLSSRNKK